MSLDYDLRNIADRDVHFPPNDVDTHVLGTLNLKVHAAIFGCIPVQIGEITAKNADEWFDRYMFWNRLNGYDEQPLTREDVHNLVGLKTNVFPNMTHSRWLQRQWELSVTR